MTAALEGDEWLAARLGRTLPLGKTRYPLYRRLGGHQGRSGREENLVPTGIRPRTVQPVVSRYTNWATRPTLYIYIYIYIYIKPRYNATVYSSPYSTTYWRWRDIEIFLIWNFSSQSLVVVRSYPGAFQDVATHYPIFKVVSARLKCLVYIAV